MLTIYKREAVVVRLLRPCYKLTLVHYVNTTQQRTDVVKSTTAAVSTNFRGCSNMRSIMRSNGLGDSLSLWKVVCRFPSLLFMNLRSVGPSEPLNARSLISQVLFPIICASVTFLPT
ncbi:hypothetical protein WN66_00016 [Saccharomyces cerevisiae]|nr:hypothetical protein WN66_00016 [Saccharomyces cerevisiae]